MNDSIQYLPFSIWLISLNIMPSKGFPGATSGKEPPPANAGNIRDIGSIPGSGRSLGGGHGNPFPYSCLENPMDRGTWWATVHWVTKIWNMTEATVQAQHLPSMLLQMSNFHSFFWLNSFPLHTTPSSSTDRHLGYFHILAIVNNAILK